MHKLCARLTADCSDFKRLFLSAAVTAAPAAPLLMADFCYWAATGALWSRGQWAVAGRGQ